MYSFGARRMHPAIAPMIERAAYIGGFDGVSGVKSAEVLGIQPVGTMAHALIADPRRAARVVRPSTAPSIRACRAWRWSTPSRTRSSARSRPPGCSATSWRRCAWTRLPRGEATSSSILREVRWELDPAGFSHVRIFVSGGIDEATILELNRYAAAYGVGTAVSNAPVIDFSLDIVEMDGPPTPKRGKLSGRKHLWRCDTCGNRGIAPSAARLGDCPRCGHRVHELLQPMHQGRRAVRSVPAAPESPRPRARRDGRRARPVRRPAPMTAPPDIHEEDR